MVGFRFFRFGFFFSQLLASLVGVNLYYLSQRPVSIKRDGMGCFLWDAFAFNMISLIGVIANVSIAYGLYVFGYSWVLAGLFGGAISMMWAALVAGVFFQSR